MTNIYVTGEYHDYHMRCYASIELVGKKKKAIIKELSGSKPECEVNAIGIVLNAVRDSNSPCCIYTDFQDAVKWANGEQRAVAKRTKEFLRYLRKQRQLKEITFIANIPGNARQELQLLADSEISANFFQGNPFKKRANEQDLLEFQVTVFRPDKSILLRLTHVDFGGILQDAVFFADWYETEGKRRGSLFYGCSVQRIGVPTKL